MLQVGMDRFEDRAQCFVDEYAGFTAVDDVKLNGALQKQREEDPTLSVQQGQDTGETVLHGQGEMHLIATVDRLAKNYALKVTTHKPQVAFKETIRRAVHEHGRLKKQSGGHGQFADVKIDIAPREAIGWNA